MSDLNFEPGVWVDQNIARFNLKDVRDELQDLLDEIIGKEIYDDRTKMILHEKVLNAVYKLITDKQQVYKYAVKVAISQNTDFRYMSVMSALWEPTKDEVISMEWTNSSIRVFITIAKTNVW